MILAKETRRTVGKVKGYVEILELEIPKIQS